MNIAFVGFGTVGKNVAVRLQRPELGLNLRTVAIVDSTGAAICHDGLDLETAIEVKNKCSSISEWHPYGLSNITTLDVLERVDIDLVIETTTTDIIDGEPGLSNITSALSRGIDVITTNKGPIALALYQLKEIAERSGSRLRYSGTVGGGTPILDFAKHQLKNEKILSVKGVLNSTSNYILWKMAKDKVNLKDVLQEAKNRKIAERDSRYDITGIDTACKLVILANSIMGLRVNLKDVEIEGIENVSLNNVLEAENAGKAVRLIGRIEDRLRVSPELIAKTDPLYVEADNNSICFSTEYNNYILIGKGAGGKETANTVIRDLLDLYQVELLHNKTVPKVAPPLVR